jgi:ketosteroid isomerase-like protein
LTIDQRPATISIDHPSSTGLTTMRNWLLFLLPLALGCTKAADPKQTEAALMAADRAFNQATSERGADGWAEYFAPDALQYGGGSKPIEGPAAIRQDMLETLKPGVKLTWEPTKAFASTGDLGYTIGRWEFTGPAGGPTAHGSYVTIWRKQPTGKWLVVLDIGNPDK